MYSHKALSSFWSAFSSSMIVVAVSASSCLIAQEKPSSGDPASQENPRLSRADKSLADQIRELQAMAVRLEAALERSYRSQPASTPQEGLSTAPASTRNTSKGSMKGMSGKPGMKMGAMSAMGGKKKMGGMKGRGMKMMGKMTGSSWSRSALPGFPGASHLYHMGATGFFLDHSDHITLETEQQATLNKMSEKAMLKQASFDRRIDEAEQGLWELTSADQPDAKQVEAKIREIEKLRGDQRLAFVRSVGEAARALTQEQRQTLAGTASRRGFDTKPQGP